jgi:superfamily II DNA/RNA helicase
MLVKRKLLSRIMLTFMIGCSRSRTTAFVTVVQRSSTSIRTRSVSSLHSTPAPWLQQQEADEPTSKATKDQSAISKSRAPFRMPKGSEDDSVPTGPTGVLAWTQLGLLTELVKSVHDEQGLLSPTPVQQLVIPALLQEPPQMLAFLAATGSGKTLAYTLPLLQMVKSRELFDTTRTEQSKPKRPKILILAPTRELAVQITQVVKLLCHKVKLSSQSLVGSDDYGIQRKALDRRLDVLVATPGRLLKHWNAGNVHLGDLQHVVVDEMDTMLEQGFQGDLVQLLHPLLYKSKSSVIANPNEVVPDAPRIVLTSATMTQAVSKLITQSRDETMGAKRHYTKPNQEQEAITKVSLPKMNIIKAPGLHKAVPRLQQVFVDVANIDKLTLLVDAVHAGGRGAAVKRSDTDDNALTMIFCNTVASCRAASHALAEAGLPSLSYHGELNSIARSDNLNRFRQAGEGDAPSILVCTDLAARGLDVPEVDHVVMFDFPLNALDYLHRSGRTARGVTSERKGNGRVTALVAKRDRVLATAIEKAVQRGDALDGLSSRKSDYIPSRAGGAATPSVSRRPGGGPGAPRKGTAGRETERSSAGAYGRVKAPVKDTSSRKKTSNRKKR